MRHMVKVQAAAKAATEMIKSGQATYAVDYNCRMGYTIQIRWHNGLQPAGMNLVISEALSGSHPNLRQYVMGMLGEHIRDSRGQ